MDSQEQKSSSMVAMLVIFLLAIAIAAGLGGIYAYHRISTLESSLTEKDALISEYQSQLEQQSTEADEAIKNVIQHTSNYIKQLESVIKDVKLGPYEDRLITNGKENMMDAMDDALGGIYNLTGIDDFIKYYFD